MPLAGMTFDVVALEVGRTLNEVAVDEAARISAVFRGFHSRKRNRGSGVDDPSDGLAILDAPVTRAWFPKVIGCGGECSRVGMLVIGTPP